MKPRLFIGSSVEGKQIADLIQANFSHDAYPTVWHQMVFTASSYPLDSLLRAVAGHDFAILVLSPDDVATIRGERAVVPRTNVVFEAALFIGRFGRDRCFIVQPRGHSGFTLPTDLLGLIPATYDEKHYEKNPPAAVGTACTEIRDGIKKSVSFNRVVSISPTLHLEDGATSKLNYPKKLNLHVKNSTTSTVLVTSLGFEVGAALSGDPRRRVGGKNHFKVEFLAYRNHAGEDIYQTEALLKPGESARAWLALDNGTNDSVAQDALKKGELGMWRLGCHWLTEPLEYREYEFQY